MKMSAKIGDLVVPGDILSDFKTQKSIAIIGPGLKRHEDSNSICATRAGKLCFKEKNYYWIENEHKRYIPRKGDLVIGIVSKKGSDLFKIDIGSSEYASLSAYAFEGATKKQKPDLQMGDAIYAKVLSAHREMEPELVCVDQYYKAGTLGPLSHDGFIITLPISFIHKLLTPEYPLLATLGKKYEYEVVVGVNGKVWLNSRSIKDTLSIMNALNAAQYQCDNDIRELCRQCK